MSSELTPEQGKPTLPDWYDQVLSQVTREIREAQSRALHAANAEMISLYWRIGSLIVQRRAQGPRYAGVVRQLAADLRIVYPDARGFSARSLRYMAAFTEAWPEGIEHQAVSNLPWGHVMSLLDKAAEPSVRDFYARLAIEHGWSRNVLVHHLATALHERIGQAPNTFERTLPAIHQEVGQHIARDPYMLDFLGLRTDFHERDLHQALLANLTRFLQELGVGFAFVGSEYRIPVGNNEAILDLLFYHIRLRRYVVFELKTGEFQPEYAGKLNYYINVVDGEIRDPEHDGETIGILLVASHDKIQVEYALHRINAPMAVSQYQTLPAEVREALPSEEQLARAVTQTTAQIETNTSSNNDPTEPTL